MCLDIHLCNKKPSILKSIFMQTISIYADYISVAMLTSQLTVSF